MSVRVLLADDSAVARTLLSAVIERGEGLELVGAARNGLEAVEMAERLAPDVVVMDVQMPGLDGIAATREIMRRTPRPVVIVSSLDARDSKLAFDAIAAGALAGQATPPPPGAPEFEATTRRFAESLRSLAAVQLRRSAPAQPQRSPTLAVTAVDLVAIGASTGGPAALGRILGALPADLGTPIVIVQHIVDGFDRGLAAWLDTQTPLRVALATDGQRAQPGDVLIAPSGSHMAVRPSLTVRIERGPPIGGHRPAATHLFHSVAAFGPRALSVILTGMGADGVPGLVAVKARGGTVIAQDGPSCVIHGMPRKAVRAGAVDRELPLDEIASAIAAATARRPDGVSRAVSSPGPVNALRHP